MSQKRVLIVDDSPLVRGILDDAFSAGGYRTRLARDGREALEMLDGEAPDLIVSDILMPETDGWELFDQIRQRPHLDVVPFMFLTQEKELSKKVRGLKMGAQDYITKPFATDEVLARAERVLERTALKAPAAPAAPPPLSGHTGQVSVIDLLQLLSINGRTGIVRLTGGDSGNVYLSGGRIVNAFCGHARGRKALFRIVGWEDVAFHFEARDAAGVAEEITEPASRVLVEGLVERDELQRSMERLPGSSRLAATEEGRAAAARREPPAQGEAVASPGGQTGQREPTTQGEAAGTAGGKAAEIRSTKPAKKAAARVSELEADVLGRALEPVSLTDLLDDLQATDGAIARTVESLLRRGLLEAR